VLDAVALEQRGIPTVTFVTEPFVGAARAVARSLGLPDLVLVVIPHDYLVEDDDALRARLEPVFTEVVTGVVATG
jgi:hypothetical protein